MLLHRQHLIDVTGLRRTGPKDKESLVANENGRKSFSRPTRHFPTDAKLSDNSARPPLPARRLMRSEAASVDDVTDVTCFLRTVLAA